MKSKLHNAPDLTKRPPRSPRVRLGGYVILARCLDKGRATLAGQQGEYQFNCPLDQHLLQFAGIKADALKKQLALGKGDGEILEWIAKHSTTKPQPWEITQWSAHQSERGPTDAESHEYFTTTLAKLSKKRDDVVGWFDLLDLDDYVSFGGKA
ncbi:MAG TPA: DUF5069 domain-containing protein [Verrucomicrobiae bacterium]|nr:DUF5069 domain-containing protein [Verrucomicrobiae bacterium]